MANRRGAAVVLGARCSRQEARGMPSGEAATITITRQSPFYSAGITRSRAELDDSCRVAADLNQRMVRGSATWDTVSDLIHVRNEVIMIWLGELYSLIRDEVISDSEREARPALPSTCFQIGVSRCCTRQGLVSTTQMLELKSRMATGCSCPTICR